MHDPVAALIFCHPQSVDFAVVNGQVLVEEKQPLGVELPHLIEQHNRAARQLLVRAGLA